MLATDIPWELALVAEAEHPSSLPPIQIQFPVDNIVAYTVPVESVEHALRNPYTPRAGAQATDTTHNIRRHYLKG